MPLISFYINFNNPKQIFTQSLSSAVPQRFQFVSVFKWVIEYLQRVWFLLVDIHIVEWLFCMFLCFLFPFFLVVKESTPSHFASQESPLIIFQHVSVESPNPFLTSTNSVLLRWKSQETALQFNKRWLGLWSFAAEFGTFWWSKSVLALLGMDSSTFAAIKNKCGVV